MKQLVQRDPGQFVLQTIGSTGLICQRNGADFQIVLSDEMMPKLVQWYHAATIHAEGMDRLEASIRRHFHHPKLREEIRTVVRSCDTCQRMKRGGRQFGELTPREALAVPWQEIHVDMIGPWTIKLRGQALKFIALTTIDPVTNLLELCSVKQKMAKESRRALELSWLCRYPRPLRCVHDNGSEFTGHDFQFFLDHAGIKSRPVTAHNPQSNGIIERVHQTVGQILRTLVHAKPPTTADEAALLVEDALAQAMLATRCVSHGSLNNISPGAVTFHRDMFLDLPFVADLLSLQRIRQGQIDGRLLKANAKRLSRDWKVDEQVLIRNAVGAGDRLKPTFRGPYRILTTHTNGNVTVRHPNGIQERIHIRRLKPYASQP